MLFGRLVQFLLYYVFIPAPVASQSMRMAETVIIKNISSLIKNLQCRAFSEPFINSTIPLLIKNVIIGVAFQSYNYESYVISIVNFLQYIIMMKELKKSVKKRTFMANFCKKCRTIKYSQSKYSRRNQWQSDISNSKLY